jgi:hypothetical protein
MFKFLLQIFGKKKQQLGKRCIVKGRQYNVYNGDKLTAYGQLPEVLETQQDVTRWLQSDSVQRINIEIRILTERKQKFLEHEADYPIRNSLKNVLVIFGEEK